MEVIQNWFNNNCDYAKGLDIYAGIPTHNKNILKNLKRRKSKVNLVKLKYELQRHLPNTINLAPKPVNYTAVLNTVETATQATLAKYNKQQAVYFHQLPPELQPVLLQANTLFKELCLLKVQLNALPANATRKANNIQLNIHLKRIKNQQCWDKIDYYKTHKLLPPAPPDKYKNLTPTQLHRQDLYLTTSIFKLKKRISINKEKLKQANTQHERTRLKRAIAKAQGNVLLKNDLQIKIKDLIYGTT